VNIESLLSEMDPLLGMEIPQPDPVDARDIAATTFKGGAGARVAHAYPDSYRHLALTTDRRRRRVALAVLAAAAVVTGIVVPLTTLHTSETRAQPGPPLPSAAGAWSLAGYITSPGWQESSALGPLPTTQQFTTQLTCPTTTTCYSDGTYLPSLHQNSRAVISVTHDGGSTWRVSLQPDDETYFFGFTCPTTTTCMVAGQIPNAGQSPSMYVTTDGGQSWTSHTIPGVNLSPVLLSCATSSTCVVMYSSSPTSSVSFITSDGGETWTATKLPPSFVPSDSTEALQCFAGGRCIVTGSSPVGSKGESRASAIYSTDGGATWSMATVPDLGAIVGIMSCSSQVHCTSIESNDNSAGFQTSSGVLVTNDGGQSWSMYSASSLTPSGVVGISSVDSISCPTDSQCWATGESLGSTCQGSCPYVPAIAFIMTTNDGGQTWSSQPLPNPPSTSLQYVSAYPVSCSTGTECFVVGTLGSTELSSKAGLPFVEQDVVLTNGGGS